MIKKVDAVRAFWATVNDKNAKKGIVATTSRLTKGADEYCKAKLYRLGACEEKKDHSLDRKYEKMRIIKINNQ